MFCAKCGAVLADDAIKCDKCGAPVRIRPGRDDKAGKNGKSFFYSPGEDDMLSQEDTEVSLPEEVLMEPVFFKEAGGNVDVDAIIKIARGEETESGSREEDNIEDDRPTEEIGNPDLDITTYLAGLPLMEKARRSFSASLHRMEEAADKRRMRNQIERASRHYQAQEEAARKAEEERVARIEREKAEAERAAQAAKERVEAERAAKIAREKAEAERAAQMARERAEAERAAQMARERAEAERAAQMVRERAEAERAAQMVRERAEAERAAQAARERAEAERAREGHREDVSRAEVIRLHGKDRSEATRRQERERAEAARREEAERVAQEALWQEERARAEAARREEAERAAKAESKAEDPANVNDGKDPREALREEEIQIEKLRRLRRYRDNRPDNIDDFLGRYGLSKETAVRIATLFLIAVLSLIYVMGRGNAPSTADQSYAGEGMTGSSSVEEQETDGTQTQSGQDAGETEVPTGGGDFQNN